MKQDANNGRPLIEGQHSVWTFKGEFFLLGTFIVVCIVLYVLLCCEDAEFLRKTSTDEKTIKALTSPYDVAVGVILGAIVGIVTGIIDYRKYRKERKLLSNLSIRAHIAVMLVLLVIVGGALFFTDLSSLELSRPFVISGFKNITEIGTVVFSFGMGRRAVFAFAQIPLAGC